MADDFSKEHLPPERPRRGPGAVPARSEVITLAVFGQWDRCARKRAFWRYATQRLGHLFPRRGHRSQFSRLQRHYHGALSAFGRHLAKRLNPSGAAYAVLHRCGLATRWCGRRGAGHLPEYTDKGLCSRLGFFHGVQLLSAVTPEGVLTGFGLAPASAKDQPMAQSFFALRPYPPQTRLPQVGQALGAVSMCWTRASAAPPCTGSGDRTTRTTRTTGCRSCARPRKGHRAPWPECWCRWLASLRQIVETVHGTLLNAFGLGRERPHEMSGLFARLWAKMALHNMCIWLNKEHGRSPLAFADLLAWQTTHTKR